MNLSTIVDRAGEIAGRKDTAWDDRITQWVNNALDIWASRLPWPTLQRAEDFTFNSSESTGRVLVLPQRVMKILSVADKTNIRSLERADNPDLDVPAAHLQNTSGAAFTWRELGMVATFKQPSTASQISVQTGASDTFTCFVEGLALDTTVSGTPDALYQARETIDVSSSSTTTGSVLFSTIDILGKSKMSTAGDVVVSAGSDRLARISKDEYRPQYRRIELTYAPLAGTVFHIGYALRPLALRNNHDQPHVSVNPNYLIEYAAAEIQEAQGNIQESLAHKALADRLLNIAAEHEKLTGDQDFRSYPESNYWAGEDIDVWPPS